MMKFSKVLFTSCALAALISASEPAYSQEGNFEQDKRIKTLVYSDSDVYSIVTRPGFQTNIEFAPDEFIDTISLGDPIGWQVTPATKRIFIKPLQKTGVTNLSVITNKRNYQFELVAASSPTNSANHAYLVRFYYPEAGGMPDAAEDRTRGTIRPVSATPIPEMPTPAMPSPELMAVPPAPPAMMPPSATLPGDISAPPLPPTMLSPTPGMNFNYTLTGPDNGAPIKIYDDGKSTFFEFRDSNIGNFSTVNFDGSEMPVPARPAGNNIFIVDQVASKFTIRNGSDLICVFNEQKTTPGAQ